MPQFFTEGIAEVVQGDDDFNAGAISTIKSFVNDTSILEEALGLGEGTETSNAYPAFLAQQSLDVTSFVGDSSQAETFSCDTKSAVITNYDEDDTIYFDKAVNNFSVSDTFNDFQVESSAENKLIIRDVRGKTMTFNTPNGTAYAYMAADSAEVAGKISTAEIILKFFSAQMMKIVFCAQATRAVIFGAEFAATMNFSAALSNTLSLTVTKAATILFKMPKVKILSYSTIFRLVKLLWRRLTTAALSCN